MNIKRLFLQLLVISIMVFGMSYATDHSYAYWASNVAPASATVTETVTVGDWTQIYQWDPNSSYLAGDQVINNGIIYEAKRDNPTREPGVDGGWNRGWTQIS